MYRDLTLMLRVVFSTVRNLPAYTLFKNLKRNRTAPCNLTCSFLPQPTVRAQEGTPYRTRHLGQVATGYGTFFVSCTFRDELPFEVCQVIIFALT